MTSPGRGDLGGIDNEALDFSQLEDYINNENTNAIYFHEALVGSELKLAEPVKEQGFGGGSNRNSSVTRANSSPLTVHLSSDHSSLVHVLNESTSAASAVTTGPVIPKTSNFRNTIPVVTPSFTKPHHLPDSPPDSGSEPPFSPPNEDPKLNSASATSDMLQQVPAENLKQYMSYGHTQPLKHLPDVISSPHHSSTLPGGPIAIQSPHSTSLPHLSIGQPHSPGGQLLTQLPQTILAPLVGNNLVQPQQTLVTSGGHLGSLYGGGEDFLYDNLASSPTSTSTSNKKRKLSDSPKPSRNYMNGVVHVKTEPPVNSPDPVHSSSILPSGDEDYSFDLNGTDSTGLFLDANYQCIRFQPFQQNTWVQLLDGDMQEIPPPNFRVDADKGFNYSNADESFVCQKKNHFQVTVHVQPVADAHYIRTPEGTKPIERFSFHFHGVKMESPTQLIKVEQSQSDRSKKPFHPVPVELVTDQVTKTTVGRLHFSETTSNNMRKKGKPNPDQRFFFLVVSLCTHVPGDVSFPVIAHASEKIIVRASNPGQFENDMELSWQKGHTTDSIFHAGRVGINTDRPEESLVVHGNIKVTGHIVQPSDLRAKVDIQELDTREQLKNVASMRIVRYKYLPEFSHHVGATQMSDTGVIAQEVQHILPEAVLEAGDVVLADGRLIDKLLVVNKERIFMENVGAVKELCKVTDNLENRIDELERINRKLTSIKRKDSWKSTSTEGSRVSSVTSHGRKKNKMKHARQGLTNHTSCTNHFVQSTIVILVLVMAFCLISMATLYIMEWQSRHTALYFSTSAASQTKRIDISNSSVTSTTMSPGSFSTKVPETVVTVYDASPVSTNQSNINNRLESTQSTESIFLSTKKSDVLIGEPIGCSNSGSCAEFCCDVINERSSENIEIPEMGLTNEQIEKKRDGSNTMQYNTQGDASTDQSNLKKTVSDIDMHNNFIDRIRKLQRREISNDQQLPKSNNRKGERMELPDINFIELNITLSSSLCNFERLNPSSERITCNIWLSKYMALNNITVSFSLQNHIQEELCDSSQNENCRHSSIFDQKTHSIMMKREVGAPTQENSWELPVGSFFKSSYRFRFIPQNLLPSNLQVCSLNEDQHSFTEYILTFQRRCTNK